MDKRSYHLFESLKTSDFYQTHHRPVIVADNLRTPENMGAVLRLAGNIGALKTLFLSSEARGFRKYKIRRTASGAETKTDWQIIGDIQQLKEKMPADYVWVALETSTSAGNIYSFRFPEKTAFVIGNEMTGICDELMKMVRSSVYIPLPGMISSMNVTHALSAALFEWYRQMTGQ